MPIEDIVIPEFKVGIDSKEIMAKLITENNHDLVIEVGNQVKSTRHRKIEAEADVHSHLVQEYDWTGKYVTVNPEGGMNQKYKAGKKSKRLRTRIITAINDLIPYLEKNPQPDPVHTRGDEMDYEHINKILEITKPENPVYVVNGSVGSILQDKSSSNKRVWQVKGHDLAKSIEIWINNITKTTLSFAYFSESVIPDSISSDLSVEDPYSRLEVRTFSTNNGISESTHNFFLEQLRKNSWGVIDREFASQQTGDLSRQVLYIATR